VLGEDELTDDLAEAFAAPFTLHARLRSGSLRATAHALGKSIIVYETGESLRLDEPGIEEAIAGTLRVLHHLGMSATPGPVPARPSIVCRRHRWLRARYAGLFRAWVKLGDYVEKGQVYGSVSDPYGLQSVRLESPVNGYVIGFNNMPVVNQGDALLHLACGS
jgi:predicted deacylase